MGVTGFVFFDMFQTFQSFQSTQSVVQFRGKFMVGELEIP